MQEKIQRVEQFGKKELSRRDFIARGIVFGTTGSGMMGGLVYSGAEWVKNARPEAFSFISLYEYEQGFEPLLSSHPLGKAFYTPESSESYANWEYEENEKIKNRTVIYKGKISSEGVNQIVDLSLYSAPTERVSSHAVIVSVGDNDDARHYLLPVVQSLRPTKATTQLILPEGTHDVTVHEASNVPSLHRDALLGLEVTTPKGTQPQRVSRNNSALYAVRPDNIGRFTNDMLILAQKRLAVNGNILKEDTVNNYFAEDGGLSAEMRDHMFGRVADVDGAEKKKFAFFVDKDGEVSMAKVPIKDSLIGQVRHHQHATFTGEMIGNHPILQIKERNNMFGFRNKSNVYYSPPPLFFPPEVESIDFLYANPETMILSYREEYMYDKSHEWMERLKADSSGMYPTLPAGCGGWSGS